MQPPDPAACIALPKKMAFNRTTYCLQVRTRWALRPALLVFAKHRQEMELRKRWRGGAAGRGATVLSL